jgi:hypothetical protein
MSETATSGKTLKPMTPAAVEAAARADRDARAGGPPLTMLACAVPTEGAPSLRFLQGRAAMLLVLFDLLRCRAVSNPLAQAFPAPALRKEREGRGTPSVAVASELKS